MATTISPIMSFSSVNADNCPSFFKGRSIFSFTRYALEEFENTMVKLNRSIRAAGLPIVEYTVTERIVSRFSFMNETGIELPRWAAVNMYDVELSTPLSNYCVNSDVEVLGVVDHDNDIVHLFNFDEEDTVKKYLHSSCLNCDVCHRKIARKSTLIVRIDGNIMQVGGKCIEKFLSLNFTVFAKIAKALCPNGKQYAGCSDFDGTGASMGGSVVASLEFAAQHMVACIRERGYVSGHDEDSTRTMVENTFYGAKELYTVENEDIENAKKVIEFLRNKEIDNNSSIFDNNVHSIIMKDGVSFRNFGYLCAGVNSALKAMNNNEEYLNEFVGEENKKYTFELTVVAKREIQNYNYDSTLYFLKDEAGHSIKWFSSTYYLEAGNKILLTATVKRHETYKDKKSTLLGGRVKLVNLSK